MNVKLTENHLYVKIPYTSNTKANKLGGKWSKREKMHRFPRNLHAMRELLKEFPQLSVNKEFMEAGKKLRAARDRLLNIRAQEDITGASSLRPYQRVDVAYLKELPSAGIFNEPRTGKTPTSIAVMKELGTTANLVVSPASLIFNWEKELRTWYPEANIYVVSGTPAKREEILYRYETNVGYEDPCILVVSKDMWKKEYVNWEDHVFGLMIVDEAHYLRNDTLQSRAVKKTKAHRRYALTGTPTVKHPSEIFGILQFLYPDKFTSKWDFIDRYWEQNDNFFGGKDIGRARPERVQELQELVGMISVQRKRHDVMKWLPRKQYQNILVQMNNKQRKLYDQMVEGFMAVDDEGNEVDTSGVLAQLTRVRQICLDPELVGLNAKSEKTATILDYVENNDEPLVVMSMFTSYLFKLRDALEAKGHKVGMIHGKMTNDDKFRSAEAFQAGKFDIILCNIISAGMGFTLDRGEVIMFTDTAWNPADNIQAEDRITPTTEERISAHTIIHLVCKDSFDEAMVNILKDKKSLTDIINEGGMKAVKELIEQRGS